MARKPFYSLHLRGRTATKQDHDAEVNRVISDVWNAAVVAQLGSEEAADVVEEFLGYTEDVQQARDQIAGATFPTLEALASHPGSIPTGQMVFLRDTGFTYEALSPSSTDPDVTVGDVKLRYVPGPEGADPRAIGAPSNGVDDDAPYIEELLSRYHHIHLSAGRTYVFASVIGLPDQSLYADETYRLEGEGANVILDGVAAGDAIFTSSGGKAAPNSTANLFAGKFEISGVNFTQRSQSVLINGDRIYNVRVHHNHFRGVHAIAKSYRARMGHDNGYFQSVYITDNHIVECDWIIHGFKAYNVVIDSNLCERCAAGVHLVDPTQIFSAHNLRVTNNLFEGGGQFLRVGNTIAGHVTGNYLEKNTIGAMPTAKCNFDLRYANVQPFDNRGSWHFGGNSFQNDTTQTNDAAFFDILIDQGFENVSFAGGDWSNARLTNAPVPNITGTYNRGRMSTPYILPRTMQSAGFDAIRSSLIRATSNYVVGSEFRYLTLQLSGFNLAAEYRPYTFDLDVKLEGENANSQVFAVASFKSRVMLSPVGSGMFGSAGRSESWQVSHQVTGLLQQDAGLNIDTATSTLSVQMFNQGSYGTGAVTRVGTLVHLGILGWTAPAVVGRDPINRVRTHIAGTINGVSRLDGTAAHWLSFIN